MTLSRKGSRPLRRISPVSVALVGIQLGAIVFIGSSGSWIARRPEWLVLEALALIPGAWAMALMLPKRFNVLPEVRPGATLITHGPYRSLRHPMYTTVLGVTLASVLDAPGFWRVVVWGALVIDLWCKMRREEKLLRAAFPAYDSYCRRTGRILPRLLTIRRGKQSGTGIEG
jgi:protein-S-isoprenylcysteine O-methyltransferase Ste14